MFGHPYPEEKPSDKLDKVDKQLNDCPAFVVKDKTSINGPCHTDDDVETCQEVSSQDLLVEQSLVLAPGTHGNE
jgi:hypothetical protein